MITHNMRDAIHYGNRLIMLHEGASSSTSPARRRKMTVAELLEMFSRPAATVADDRAILA